MKQFKIFEFFDGMAQGMSKIQEHPVSLFRRIRFHNFSFNQIASGDGLSQDSEIPGFNFTGM